MTDLQTSAPDTGHRALDTQVGTAGSGADQPRTHPSAAAAPKPLAGVSDPSSPPDTGQSGGDTHALGAVSGGDPTPPPARQAATPKPDARGVDSLLLIIADQLDDIETSRIAANNLNLTGETIRFTGSLDSMSRSRAQKLVEQLGARTTSSVSGETDVVVAGEAAGSKQEKARKLKVRILSEAGFLDLLTEHGVEIPKV